MAESLDAVGSALPRRCRDTLDLTWPWVDSSTLGLASKMQNYWAYDASPAKLRGR